MWSLVLIGSSAFLFASSSSETLSSILYSGMTAVGRFRRDVADGRAAGGAGEPAVRDERDFLVEACARDGGGRREHLSHAGAAGGTFVPDDDDVAGFDLLAVDGLDGLFLTLEDAGRALVDEHFRSDGASLDDTAVRSEVAV